MTQDVGRALIYGGVACIGFPFGYELVRTCAGAWLLANLPGGQPYSLPAGDMNWVSFLAGVAMIATAVYLTIRSGRDSSSP